MTSTLSIAGPIRSAPKTHSTSPPIPSGTPPLAVSSRSTNGRTRCCLRKKSIAARPSRPSPQIATRCRSRSSARIENGHVGRRNPVAMPHLEQRAILCRSDLAQRREVFVELVHDPVFPPVRAGCEIRHHRRAFGGLPDAFERFLAPETPLFPKPVALACVVEKIAAENFDQVRFREKRRKRKEDKSAFRAIAAPVTPTSGGCLPEGGIAATKFSEIRRIFRESAGDLDFRQRPQQRKVIDTR